MKQTIQVADKPTADETKVIAESNAEKLDGIAQHLESGGMLADPDCGLPALKQYIDELKNYVGNGKRDVANAITAKGVTTATDASFAALVDNIDKIVTLMHGTQDATAGAGQILSGYTAYAKGGKVTGTIPSQGAQTITPGTSAKTIAAGRYLSGEQTIAGDANLIPANIAKGKSIFGITGNYSGSMATGSLSTDFTNSTYSVDVYLHTQTINLGFKPSVLILYVTADNHSALTAYISNFGIHGYNYSWNESYHILLTEDANRGLVLLDNGFRLSREYICKITLPANTRISNRQAAYIALP